MTKRTKHLSILASMALALVVVVSLAACGGSADSSTGSDDSGQAGYTTVEDGKLTMISNFYFPPFVSMEDGTGDFIGYDVDLYKALCDKLGLEPNILPSVQFDTIVPTIKQGGKADVSLGAITITDEREQEVDMSEAYMDSNQALVVKKGATDNSIDSLNVEGMKVAVQSGTTGESWVRENLPKATCVPLDDIIQCLSGVQTGLYNASVCDLPVASYEIKTAYSDLETCLEIPTGEQYGVVISKDNPELTKAVNQALKELEDDGTIGQLEEKWFGQEL